MKEMRGERKRWNRRKKGRGKQEKTRETNDLPTRGKPPEGTETCTKTRTAFYQRLGFEVVAPKPREKLRRVVFCTPYKNTN
jgi:hypothetical protein